MTSTDPSEARIEAFRKIVATAQLGRVDGVPIYLFTASHVVAMDEQLSPPAKELYRRMEVQRMADLAFDSLRHQLRARGQRR
jgi:hypothetical protein